MEILIIFAAASGLVAQWIEQQPSKLRVIGSNPIGVTFIEFIFFIQADVQPTPSESVYLMI
jgi:hypothetical protein